MLTWEDVPGWFSWPDIYDAAVARAPLSGAKFVELGVWCGRSATYMATKIKESGKSIQFDAVENFSRSFSLTERMTRAFIGQTGLQDYINLRVMHQMEAVSLYDDASLDFVFVDSDHSYEGTRDALAAYLPKVKPGGMLAGDDYSPKRFPWVVSAVDEVLPGRSLVGAVFTWVVPA